MYLFATILLVPMNYELSCLWLGGVFVQRMNNESAKAGMKYMVNVV
jgi:hypothetical protein